MTTTLAFTPSTGIPNATRHTHVTKNGTTTHTPPSRRRRAHSAQQMNVRRVHTPTDFQAAMPMPGGHTNEQTAQTAHPLLVFSFVTQNCRACRYASTGFARLAREFEEAMSSSSSPRTKRHVRFFEVDISDSRNQQLGQRLGVDAVPAFQMYAFKNAVPDAGWKGGFGVLDEFVGARVVGEVRKRLLHYSSPEFDIDEYGFDDGM